MGVAVMSESSIVSMGMTLCPPTFARCAELMALDFNWNTKFHHRALTHWKKARHAAMLGHDLRDNRKTQSRATRRTASRRIGPHESLEEPFALFHVDAFAIITNVHDGEGLFVVGSKLQFSRRVTRRIVNDVTNHAFQHRRITPHPGRLHRRGVDVQSAVRTNSLRLFEEQVVQIDVNSFGLNLVLVVTSQPKESVDDHVKSTTD